MSDGLQLEWTAKGNNGTGILTARIDAQVIHADTGDLAKSNFRDRFIDRVCRDRLAISRPDLDKELCRLAGEIIDKAKAEPGQVYEGEPTIVRPERFILPAVSGLACPVATFIDGKPAGKWILYLRWSDGRREGIDLPDYIDLDGNRRLWFYPKLSEPEPTLLSGWSMTSRRAWLDGGPVPDPAELFQRLCERVAYFIDLPADRAAGIVGTLTLWSILTYNYSAWDAIPYLYVGGPLGSGKTRIFEILDRLCFRPINSSSMTGPCLFRTLHDRGGTFLLDEAERLKADTPEVKELLTMLLAGYKRGGKAVRLEAVGDTFKPIQFDVYGTKAMACIAGLPPALISRCIPLTMFRAAPESVKPRRRIDEDPSGWQRLRDDLHIVALEHGPIWRNLSRRSDVCPDMTGRNFELWQPILALAKWLEESGAARLSEVMTRYALDTIESAQEDQTPDADEILLRTIAEMIRTYQSPAPGEILKRIQDHDLNLFSKWTGRTVSNRLRQYGIPSPRKSTHGRRVYNNVGMDLLLKIQKNYGVDLELSPLSPPSPPDKSDTSNTGGANGTIPETSGLGGSSGQGRG